jgi:hypothetical protein
MIIHGYFAAFFGIIFLGSSVIHISMAFKEVLESLVTIFLACLGHVAVIFFRDALALFLLSLDLSN